MKTYLNLILFVFLYYLNKINRDIIQKWHIGQMYCKAYVTMEVIYIEQQIINS